MKVEYPVLLDSWFIIDPFHSYSESTFGRGSGLVTWLNFINEKNSQESLRSCSIHHKYDNRQDLNTSKQQPSVLLIWWIGPCWTRRTTPQKFWSTCTLARSPSRWKHTIISMAGRGIKLECVVHEVLSHVFWLDIATSLSCTVSYVGSCNPL